LNPLGVHHPGRKTVKDEGKPGDRPEARNLRVPDRIVSEGGWSCVASPFPLLLLGKHVRLLFSDFYLIMIMHGGCNRRIDEIG